jgi:hypothetical protein
VRRSNVTQLVESPPSSALPVNIGFGHNRRVNREIRSLLEMVENVKKSEKEFLTF